ncbi:MAG: hypothetical protein ACK56I_24930, partial [bacterium]
GVSRAQSPAACGDADQDSLRRLPRSARPRLAGNLRHRRRHENGGPFPRGARSQCPGCQCPPRRGPA